MSSITRSKNKRFHKSSLGIKVLHENLIYLGPLWIDRCTLKIRKEVYFGFRFIRCFYVVSSLLPLPLPHSAVEERFVFMSVVVQDMLKN